MSEVINSTFDINKTKMVNIDYKKKPAELLLKNTEKKLGSSVTKNNVTENKKKVMRRRARVHRINE